VVLTKKKSVLERRLQELREEEELLKRNIKSLRKALKHPDQLIQVQRVPPEGRRGFPRNGTGDPGATRAFVRLGKDGRSSAAPDRNEPGPGWRRGRGGADDGFNPDGRFASYFSVERLGAGRPLRQERSVQRNKAIFMVIFVFIVGYVVYRLIF